MTEENKAGLPDLFGQKPSLGRIVHVVTREFVNDITAGQPGHWQEVTRMPGIICKLWHNDVINAGVFDENGNSKPATSVPQQDSDDSKNGSLFWCFPPRV